MHRMHRLSSSAPSKSNEPGETSTAESGVGVETAGGHSLIRTAKKAKSDEIDTHKDILLSAHSQSVAWELVNFDPIATQSEGHGVGTAIFERGFSIGVNILNAAAVTGDDNGDDACSTLALLFLYVWPQHAQANVSRGGVWDIAGTFDMPFDHFRAVLGESAVRLELQLYVCDEVAMGCDFGLISEPQTLLLPTRTSLTSASSVGSCSGRSGGGGVGKCDSEGREGAHHPETDTQAMATREGGAEQLSYEDMALESEAVARRGPYASAFRAVGGHMLHEQVLTDLEWDIDPDGLVFTHPPASDESASGSGCGECSVLRLWDSLRQLFADLDHFSTQLANSDMAVHWSAFDYLLPYSPPESASEALAVCASVDDTFAKILHLWPLNADGTTRGGRTEGLGGGREEGQGVCVVRETLCQLMTWIPGHWKECRDGYAAAAYVLASLLLNDVEVDVPHATPGGMDWGRGKGWGGAASAPSASAAAPLSPTRQELGRGGEMLGLGLGGAAVGGGHGLDARIWLGVGLSVFAVECVSSRRGASVFGLSVGAAVAHKHRWMQLYSEVVAPARKRHYDDNLPVLFPLPASACPRHAGRSQLAEGPTEYAEEVPLLENLESSLRSILFAPWRRQVSFQPFRILPSLPAVQARRFRSSVLIDVGANEFFRSPKHLIDMYATFKPFDRVVLWDVADIPADSIPREYHAAHDIHLLSRPVRIGTRDEHDVLTYLASTVEPEDFVVLKFDIDAATGGPTMEWGFLADLLASPALALVDELYIEMHFFWPGMGWSHDWHSMHQAFDLLRQLRDCGLAVHAWN